jgi:hypothetical protein
MFLPRNLYQNNVFFFKKLFLTSAHQNYLKTLKNIDLIFLKKISKIFLKCKNNQDLTLIGEVYWFGARDPSSRLDYF